MRRVLVPHVVEPWIPMAPVALEAMGGETMGTTWSVKLALPRSLELNHVRAAIEAELGRVVAEMSTWEPDSHISQFNTALPESRHQLPEGFFTVLSCALDLARNTGGAYDPTVGPLVDLWGFGPSGAVLSVPSEASVAEAQARVSWHRLPLDREKRVLTQPGNMQLDLSSIAKGFAVDRVSRCLSNFGIGSHLVEIGGELRGAGMKPDGRPWWVALEPPPQTEGVLDPIIIALHGLSVATSGGYRRFLRSGSSTHSHTIDPISGRTVSDRILSVSVVHPDCMVADGQATALTVLGEEKAMSFAAHHDVAARLVVSSSTGVREILTPAFRALMQ